MAFIRQHVPKFFDVLSPTIAEFNSTEELLEIPFVKMYRLDTNGEPDDYFHRYSLDSKNTLIVEMDKGKFHTIVGFITGSHNLNLPSF